MRLPMPCEEARLRASKKIRAGCLAASSPFQSLLIYLYYFWLGATTAAPHRHVSFLVSRSWIVHLTVPTGLCSDALPENVPPDSLISTRRSAGLCSIVTLLPE